MARLRHLLAGLAAVGWAAGALANVSVQLGPSPALECLQPAGADASAPEYPFDEWKGQVPGRVKVRIDFALPDAAPEVTVLELEGGQPFARSVRDHLRDWRVPCMDPGRPVRLLKEYVFTKDRRQVGAPPAEDAADALRREASRCLAHVSGRSAQDALGGARLRDHGRVFLTMQFKSPSDAPQVSAFARTSSAVLRRRVEDWAVGYRLPCLSGEHVQLDVVFSFKFEGGPNAGLRPLLLQELLPRVKGIRDRPLKLDTTAMGCPFDVSWTYLRPQRRNKAGALGAWLAGREPLLDFMREVELDLPETALDAVYADVTTITVPCLKIDLNPQGDKQ